MTVRFEWKGPEVVSSVKAAALDGLLEGAEHILEEANRIVPHDEGTLMRSGETSVDSGKMAAAVSYDTPYAARLHEHPEYNFQGERQGKWLEKTLRERGADVRDYIAKKVREALKG